MKSKRKELQIPGLNVKSFPTIPVESVKSLPNNTIESNKNHLKADDDGYFKSMIMNGVSRMPHSKENESYLLDQMINEAAHILSKKVEPFKKEIDECLHSKIDADNFVATQAEKIGRAHV